MKITKRQLKRIIREAINEAEFYDETPEGQLRGTEKEDDRFQLRRASEDSDRWRDQMHQLKGLIITFVAANPGAPGAEVQAAVKNEIGWKSNLEDLVYAAMDEDMSEDDLFFNEEEDAWFTSLEEMMVHKEEGGVWSDERDHEAGFYR
jgi:hypothetical protein